MGTINTILYKEVIIEVSEIIMLQKEQIEAALNSAISHLYTKDSFLVNEDVNERSISHRLAVYLQEEVNDLEQGWDVDCEYNRIGVSEIEGEYLTKRMNLPPRTDVASDDVTAKTVFPDINIHHRGKEGPENNLLVIEMKKNSSEDGYDFEKLSQYGSELDYQWGVYINITADGADCTWWKEGELI